MPEQIIHGWRFWIVYRAVMKKKACFGRLKCRPTLALCRFRYGMVDGLTDAVHVPPDKYCLRGPYANLTVNSTRRNRRRDGTRPGCERQRSRRVRSQGSPEPPLLQCSRPP